MVKQLNRRQSMLGDYESTLEERLVLVCNPPKRLQRMKIPRRKSEYSSHDRLKRARKIYLEVLENFPLIFVPFILVVPPNACRTWKASEVQRHLKDCEGIHLSYETRANFDGIAKKRNIDQTAAYIRLRSLLFPTVSCSRPTTITEADDAWAYNAADMDTAVKFFSEAIYKAIESSPKRLREKENQFVKSTQCIQMRFPRHNQQDAIVRLDVGFDSEVVKALFPTAWERLSSVHGFRSPSQSTNRNIEQLEPHLYDNACFTLQGATVSEIPTVLGPHVYRAIKESQLRQWETDNFLLKTTDC
ncbi:hypothetical protein KXV98_004797, partial [Aspergillus fumigatus]